MRHVYFCDTDLGRVAIVDTDGALSHLEMADRLLLPDAQPGETPLTREAARQLREYIAGERKAFDLPLAPEGSAFQQRVWAALQTVPYGQTRSYGEIAAAVGNPNGARAVGNANRNNPLWIVVPCHRVVGVRGNLVGYAGGLALKRRLLELEGAL